MFSEIIFIPKFNIGIILYLLINTVVFRSSIVDNFEKWGG